MSIFKDRDLPQHPSHGMVSLARGSGARRLFGSHMDSHATFITLRVKRAETQFRHGQRYIHAHGSVCEVVLSSAQFAELITNMNVGDGVPCTLRWTQQDGNIEEPPVEVSAQSIIREDFAAGIGGLAGRLREARAAALAALDKVPEKTKKAVMAGFDAALRETVDAAPFAVDQFQRATKAAETAARAEMDALMTHVTTRLGLAALQDPDVIRKLLAKDDP